MVLQNDEVMKLLRRFRELLKGSRVARWRCDELLSRCCYGIAMMLQRSFKVAEGMQLKRCSCEVARRCRDKMPQ